MKTQIKKERSHDVERRLMTIARRLDRVYCGGRGNDVDAIYNELLLAALRAQADYREEGAA